MQAPKKANNRLNPMYQKSHWLVCALCLLFCLSTQAQKYISAIGIQGGNEEVGLSYQYRLIERNTVEGLLAFSTKHISITGLYKYHNPIITQGFNYFVGLGPHIGYLQETEETDYTYFGLSGITGVEFKFPALRLVITGSFRPSFHLNHPKNIQINAGVGFRYVLVRVKDQKKKQRQKRKGQKYDGGKIKFKKKK